ncbi:hypothetical protein GGF37_003191, partial [Kickxella alabastrina]
HQSYQQYNSYQQPSRFPHFPTEVQQIHPARPPELETAAIPNPALNNLFDSNEETYLNSFLNSFDVEGFDLGPYLASPPPMANFSTRADFSAMGMGIGAGMMGSMDDTIPHLSLDEAAQDAAATAAHGLGHMSTNMSSLGPPRYNGKVDSNGMLPMRRSSLFDYGLGSTAHLSLGNVMSDEISKVSSWLLQNQGHQSGSPMNNLGGSFSATAPTFGQIEAPALAHRGSIDGPHMQSRMVNMAGTSGKRNGSMQQQQFSQLSPDSDMLIKRKASCEQIDQPRKSRGNVWSPMREVQSTFRENSTSLVGAAAMLLETGTSAAPETPVSAGDNKSVSGSIGDGKRRGDSKKAGTQRMVLTEDERRSNHIASEQRRRNQIRQGYAELMNLVTTLKDPALGNHPGTAHSTPSKAVILSHAVQFIRGLEDGNRVLRKRIEETPRHLLQPISQQQQQRMAMQAQERAITLSAYRSRSRSPSQQR